MATKYKLLLIGKNDVLLDVFFTHMTENFECVSSTARMEDILNHLKIVTPDAIIYCLNKTSTDSYTQVISCKTKIEAAGIPLIVAGGDEECEEFNKMSVNMAAMILSRPFTASLLTEKLLKYLDGKKATEEEERRQRELAARKHVLVIDDDPIILKLIKEQLHEKYEVGTAVNGKIAMKFLEKKTVDLILLDFEMPEENGAAVLKKLHENPATKDIPVIFLTGITERDKVREAIVQKPQDYLLKPIEKDKLMSAIGRFIG